jgi:hypothetical protein
MVFRALESDEAASRLDGYDCDKEIHMKTMAHFACGVALCALTSAIAAPGYAQGNDGSYVNQAPQYSTPAEQQQTRALNQQAANGSPQDSEYEQQSGPPAEEQQQYDSQAQQYDQQQQQYQEQRQRYEADSAQYRANLRAYDRAAYDWSYPAPIVYEYGDDRRLQRLYLIAEPSQQLAHVPIEGPDGRFIGRVRNVETAPDGRPARLEIALNRRVSVWVEPGNFRFDPQDHILLTSMTRDDLWQMPGATVESGPM